MAEGLILEQDNCRKQPIFKMMPSVAEKQSTKGVVCVLLLGSLHDFLNNEGIFLWLR